MHLFWSKNRKKNFVLCIVSLYRSPNQSADEFELFKNILNLTLESVTQKNPFLTVVIGAFNARSLKWWSGDKTNQEGLKTKNLVSQFAFLEVIIKPTNISQKFNCCIDLLFINQQSLIIDSVVHPSVHSNCHHQIIYGKLRLFKDFLSSLVWKTYLASWTCKCWYDL